MPIQSILVIGDSAPALSYFVWTRGRKGFAVGNPLGFL
jgi:hypothetical protein